VPWLSPFLRSATRKAVELLDFGIVVVENLIALNPNLHVYC
jgi:hypothetical protein